mmetsp:Transcript_11802/g.28161  ORF Transcript_11802/g.28161 Transcript_11802/m.28161 type:complete len:157 (+) Transcript_11802:177-647(+)
MSDGGQIDIGKMPMEQLSQLREQLVDEDKFLTASYQQLKLASNRFGESRESLKAIKPENVGKEIMVPMTASLYIKGTLDNADSVLVDIGTGYFVEKNPKEADEYLQRKVQYLGENCERLEANISEKRKNLEAVTMVMQHKASAMKPAPQAAGAKSE